jgi:hypothetical protein
MNIISIQIVPRLLAISCSIIALLSSNASLITQCTIVNTVALITHRVDEIDDLGDVEMPYAGGHLIPKGRIRSSWVIRSDVDKHTSSYYEQNDNIQNHIHLWYSLVGKLDMQLMSVSLGHAMS